MKTTGIVRKIDYLGRISIPSEFRRTLDWALGDELEMIIAGDGVLVRKHAEGCVFCGDEENDALEYRGKQMCNACRDVIMGGERHV